MKKLDELERPKQIIVNENTDVKEQIEDLDTHSAGRIA